MQWKFQVSLRGWKVVYSVFAKKNIVFVRLKTCCLIETAVGESWSILGEREISTGRLLDRCPLNISLRLIEKNIVMTIALYAACSCI